MDIADTTGGRVSTAGAASVTAITVTMVSGAGMVIAASAKIAFMPSENTAMQTPAPTPTPVQPYPVPDDDLVPPAPVEDPPADPTPEPAPRA